MLITQQRPAGRWLPDDCFYTLLCDLILTKHYLIQMPT